MRQPLDRLAAACLGILFFCSSCTNMTISERLSPRVGVSVGSEEDEVQETDMFIRADNPTGVIFL